MDTPSTSIRGWARQLVAIEAAKTPASPDGCPHAVVRVAEKVRVSLMRLVGEDGFTALIRRALALARTEVSALQTVKIKADGRIEGIEELAAEGESGIEAATTLLAHVLGLLVVFIGVPLTRRLVREIWPEASLEE